MTDLATMTRARAQPLPLPLVSVASVLVGFAALQLVAFLNAGVFEYPLDDVYIHLAMAEQIASGNYGVNAGEVASAASSPLYPLLLTPLAGWEAQRFLPLAWNLAALVLSGWLWGRILVQAGYDSRIAQGFALVAAAVVPLLLNLAGIAYTGMEHTLHTAAGLAIVLGLLRLLDDGEVSAWLILGILLGPALRFEATALSLLAASVLILRGRPWAGIASGLGAVTVIAAFMGFLIALGLDPLPSSVQTKLGSKFGSDTLAMAVSVVRLANNWSLLAALISLLLMPRAVPGLSESPRRWLCVVIGLALLAHLLVGRSGWMNRYENYILVATVAALLALAARGGTLARLLAIAPAAVAGLVYAQDYIQHYPTATRSVDRQQAQMARFAQEFHAAPVAVNDLGRVAWGNPDYVLDIWGLGSLEALTYRRKGGPERWVGVLAERHGATLAMIYDDWFGDKIGADWVRLGTLRMMGNYLYVGRPEVAFYATVPEAASSLRDKIDAWSKGLPEGAIFIEDSGNPQ